MRVIAYIFVSLMLMTMFVPVVAQAQIDTVTKNVYVEFLPGELLPGASSNLLDSNEVYLEEDIISSVLPDEVEGRYIGPYLQSSYFEFDHRGGYVSFQTSFRFTSSTIMNGCTEYWIRVPVDGTLYSRILLNIERSVNLTDGSSDWAYCTWDYQAGNETSFAGARWIDQEHTGEVIFDQTGIYILVRGVFPSNCIYTFHIKAQASSSTTPHRMYFTSEDYEVGSGEDIEFYDYRTYDNVGEVETYRFNQSVALQLSWAFLFTKGMGDGLFSFKLPFGDRNSTYSYIDDVCFGQAMVSQYIAYTWVIEKPNGTNTTYISIYQPFYAENSVRWNITLHVQDAPMFFTDPSDPAPSSFQRWYSWEVNSTNNMLLTSSPWELNFTDYGADCKLDILLRPSYATNAMIPLGLPFYMTLPAFLKPAPTLGVPYYNNLLSRTIFPWARYYSNDDITSVDWNYLWSDDSGPGDVNMSGWNDWYYHLPLFTMIEATTGRWAEVTPMAQYTVYDFGWGKAYLFPGETSLVMFLEDGKSRFWYNGSLADAFKDETWWDAIRNAFTVIGGLVYDGICLVWNALKALGNWIWTNLVKIVGWIVSMVTDLYNKVSDIVEGMLYGFPILVVLFLVNYVGTMLYTGRIPRAGKERALFRKVVKKPLKKGYKSLKREVVLYQKGRAKARTGAESGRKADYRARLRDERAKEIARIGRREYGRRVESISRTQRAYTKQGKYYGQHVEGKTLKWRKVKRG